MVANTAPIFTKKANIATDGLTGMGAPILAAANDFTGAGANNALVFTAGAEGAYIRRLHFKAAGSNVASLARIFINNGAVNTTSTNNKLFDDMPLPITTASITGQTGPGLDFVMEMAIPAGYRIYVGLATAVASGWVVTPIAGDY